MDANVTATQPMQVIGLDDPKAREIIFRFPTTVLTSALRVIQTGYSTWVRVYSRENGPWILTWQDEELVRNGNFIKEFKVQLYKLNQIKKKNPFTQKDVDQENAARLKALQDDVAQWVNYQENLAARTAMRERVSKVIPKSSLQQRLVGTLEEEGGYTKESLQRLRQQAVERLQEFQPYTLETYRQAQIQELKLDIARLQENRLRMRKERLKAKRAIRRFLKHLVAMETAAQAAALSA